MMSQRKKASEWQVIEDIKPYITKHFWTESTVLEQNITPICLMLFSRYNNVRMVQGLKNNKPYLLIQVKKLFSTDEIYLEVIPCGRTKKKSLKRDPSWIDQLELLDAALDDSCSF